MDSYRFEGLLAAALIFGLLCLPIYINYINQPPPPTAAEIHAAYPNWTMPECELIATGRAWIGMTDDQALFSKGHPTDINRTVNASGVREQWVYRSSSNTRYYYFQDGILTSWQN